MMAPNDPPPSERRREKAEEKMLGLNQKRKGN
jgi:hypothetical protein